jgi:4-diphosphocytidyl-2-C-methyl-D-erythritol kinase
MQHLVVPAPAKLNLFLHVTGRRDDGYHHIESLFVPIALADRIDLVRRDDGAIVRATAPPGIPEDVDLALRAARALKVATDCTHGVTINVRKTIPQGAGLGGGSSDAASVLLALNVLWRLHLSRAALAEIGVALGADVPFFLGPGPALARGIGEVLAPMTVPGWWIALVAPAVHVSTPTIFAAPELTRCTPSAKMNVFSERYGRNDLQPVAAARFPRIAAALAALGRDGHARMTGSGACVFACCESRERAGRAVDAARREVPEARGFVTRILARHPLATFS